MTSSRFWTLGLLAATGCGLATDSPESPFIRSGLAQDKALHALTPDEDLQLCQATTAVAAEVASFQEQVRAVCSLTGAGLGLTRDASGELVVDRAMCERERDACIARFMPERFAATKTCQLKTMTSWTCAATVLEYEVCASAVLNATAENYARWDCQLLEGRPLVENPEMAPRERPPLRACEAYEAKCGPLKMDSP